MRIPRTALTLIGLAAILAVGLIVSGCKTLEDRLDRYLQAARDIWGFQGAALVAYDGRVILSKGYGLANFTFDQPNTPQTKFFIGSVTKQFTAAAVLKLQGEGLLAVSDPITKHLPDYPAEPGDRITIHHLLSHTSGIPNYTEIPEVVMRRTEPMNQAELMALFAEKPLDFEPGTSFHYSNSGYIVLGAIIEAVSGQSYEAYLHRVFFNPLNMHNTGYARREAGIPDRADGYTLDERRVPVDALPMHMSVLHSAGALYSTVEDMLIWDQALSSGRVLSTASMHAMLTPSRDNYGYGWVVESLFGHVHTFHGGFLDGFNCTFERWLDTRLCVIVFSNDDVAPVKKMARGLAAIMYAENYTHPLRKTPIAVTTEQLKEYMGRYRADNGREYVMSVAEGYLYFQIPPDMPMRLLPEAVDTFFFDRDNTEGVRFVRDENGTVSEAVLVTELGETRAWKSD